MPTNPLTPETRETLARSWRPRSEKQLRAALQVACNVIWNGGKAVPGEHVWTIPVDEERDFDYILGDGIAELVAARAELSRLSAALEAMTGERDTARGCPHGDDCACAIGSRHSWLEAFSAERNAKDALKAEVARLTEALISQRERAIAAELLAETLQARVTTLEGVLFEAQDIGKHPVAGASQPLYSCDECRTEFMGSNHPATSDCAVAKVERAYAALTDRTETP